MVKLFFAGLGYIFNPISVPLIAEFKFPKSLLESLFCSVAGFAVRAPPSVGYRPVVVWHAPFLKQVDDEEVFFFRFDHKVKLK
jgi:hypothetical protein